MFQRLEKMKKNAFASAILFGENNNSSISGFVHMLCNSKPYKNLSLNSSVFAFIWIIMANDNVFKASGYGRGRSLHSTSVRIGKFKIYQYWIEKASKKKK